MIDYKLHTDYVTDRISFYRTEHVVARYVEVFTVEGFRFASDLAAREKRKLFVLGNGSNLIFPRRNVQSVLVRVRIPAGIEAVPGSADSFVISATSSVMQVLQFCKRESRDSFYYLASVPASIGGAVAMNAGRGRQSGKSVFDFIESVSYFEPSSGAGLIEIAGEDAKLGYRKTIFTGFSDRIILSARFKFPKVVLEGDPIVERIKWSKANQDYSGPNCGTVFMRCRGSIMPFLRGVGWKDVHFSRKCDNWIINQSKNPSRMMKLIGLVRVLSFFLLKPAELENIVVE